jgi:hypothetical protein
MSCAFRFRSDLQPDRAAARKTKTAFQTALRGRRLSDTLPAVAVFGAPPGKGGVSLLAVRACSSVDPIRVEFFQDIRPAKTHRLAQLDEREPFLLHPRIDSAFGDTELYRETALV